MTDPSFSFWLYYSVSRTTTSSSQPSVFRYTEESETSFKKGEQQFDSFRKTSGEESTFVIKGNTEEENNGYVVFRWNIHGSDGKGGGVGRRYSGRPQPNPFLQKTFGYILYIETTRRVFLQFGCFLHDLTSGQAEEGEPDFSLVKISNDDVKAFDLPV